jgi:SPP1 family predicted phage head-tail adaptor
MTSAVSNLGVPTIGDLRQLVTIEVAARQPDGGGGAILTWSPVAEVWCAIRPRSGGETVAADRLAPSVRFEVWMRWRDDVAADMRLTFSGRILAVTAVMDPDGHRHFLRLFAEEKL